MTTPKTPVQPTVNQASATKGHTLWSVETMRLINDVTTSIKGKAFDPDWFLLRQRFEAVDAIAAQNLVLKSERDTAVAIVSDLSEWSRRWPNQRHYDSSGDKKCNEQLSAIEHRAKVFTDGATPTSPDVTSLKAALEYAEQILSATESTGEKQLGNGVALDQVRKALQSGGPR